MSKHYFRRWLGAVCTVLIGTLVPVQAETDERGTDAERSISEHEDSIHQIRIRNTGSQGQSGLGTGFFIDDGSLLATNYHVVSSVVLEPERYSAEVDLAGETQTLRVVAIDVIHDLAILSVPVQGTPLELSETVPPRGARLYSIGNPLDIGMTVVEGNYNGLVDNRFFDQIHFSGAINAGMSGGPTLNGRGAVVGINVASAGNQVGFLVPVDKLHALLGNAREIRARLEETGVAPQTRAATLLQQDIGEQIQRATHAMIDRIMAEPWPLETLGDAMVLGRMHEAVDCWGDSEDDAEKQLTRMQKGCNSRDGFFISNQLRSGFIEYEFSYQHVEGWPEASLYRHITNSLRYTRPGNRAGREDVDNYSCMDRVVTREADGLKRKIAYCTRPYLDYEGLFDTFYLAATLDRADQVLVEHYTLSGVSRADGERFLERFVEQVAWQ